METCLFKSGSKILSLWKKPYGVNIQIKPLGHNFSEVKFAFQHFKTEIWTFC